jgi:uncharacterized protein YuzE
MKLSYDPRYNIAYLSLADRASDVETLGISEELNVDISPDGRVYGIEFLNANEQLLSENGGILEIVNEALGERQEVSLRK